MGLAKPRVPTGAPLSMKDLNCFLGNTIAGGNEDPVADTIQHVVTSVPLSALIILFSCLAHFAAIIFWVFGL